MGLSLVSGPANYPITLAEAKAHLRVDSSEEDSLIETLIAAATDYCEKFTGRAFIDQTWNLFLDEFPDNEIKIPLPPLIEVLGVFYLDNESVEQTFTDYEVDYASNDYGWVVPATGGWPTPLDTINSVRIQFRAGFADDSFSPPAETVPASIKAAIFLTLGTLYANRETVVIGVLANPLPWGAEQLLRNYRVQIGMA